MKISSLSSHAIVVEITISECTRTQLSYEGHPGRHFIEKGLLMHTYADV